MDYPGQRIVVLAEHLEELLGYCQHDSWRCKYYQKCHCGLDELMEKMGLEKIPLPEE